MLSLCKWLCVPSRTLVSEGGKEADIPSTASSLRATIVQTSFHTQPDASRNPLPPKERKERDP